MTMCKNVLQDARIMDQDKKVFTHKKENNIVLLKQFQMEDAILSFLFYTIETSASEKV